MSDTPKTARVFAVAVTQPVEDAHKLWAGWAEKLERELAAVTAERDALREAAERLSNAAENMMLYWQTGNGVTVERATIRHDDPIVDALRAALRRP